MDNRLDALAAAHSATASPSPQLLTRALTHRSFGADHNERLEFLGDAVLSLAISSLLFDRFAGSDEGDLTRVRAHLVREDSLHRVALQLGLPEVLRLGEGEARGGGAQRAVDPGRRARGADRRDVPSTAASTPRRRWCSACSARSSTTTDIDELEQGRQDRAAGMAAGAARCRCRPTASPPRAARRTRRPSRSSARCRR